MGIIDFSIDNKKKVKLFVTIIERGKGKIVSEIIGKFGVLVKLVVLGYGTADSEMLDYLGLGQTEKDVVIFTAGADISKTLLKKLSSELSLRKNNTGIAFSIPINGAGGIKTLGMLAGITHLIDVENKEDVMNADTEKKNSFDLIITIVNRGFSDDVMAAARSKGAEGGTIIHARGTGIHETEKFFGISIQPEKEMVLILTPRYKKSGIIKEICEKAGLTSPGKGISFSMPVDDIVGIVHLIKEQNQLKD